MSLVMVVEDSKATARVICNFLAEIGVRSIHMDAGEKALEYFRDNKGEMPDAILMDWNMPHMTGYECLLELKKLNLPKLPTIILCTSDYDFEKISMAMEAGMAEYIMKPFDKIILGKKLKMSGVNVPGKPI